MTICIITMMMLNKEYLCWVRLIVLSQYNGQEPDSHVHTVLIVTKVTMNSSGQKCSVNFRKKKPNFAVFCTPLPSKGLPTPRCHMYLINFDKVKTCTHKNSVTVTQSKRTG